MANPAAPQALGYTEPALPADEAQRLRELAALGIVDTPRDDRFDAITDAAARLFGVPIALVSIIDADRQWFKANHGLGATQTSRAISFCGHAILEPDQVFVVDDADADPRFRGNPLVTGDPFIRFYAGVPIKSPGQAPVGTLCLIDRQPRTFSKEDERVLRALGRWVEIEMTLHAVGQRDVRAMATRGSSESPLQAIDHARFWNLGGDMFCIAGTDGYFKDVNQRFEEVLGKSREEILDQPFMEYVHPDDVEATQQEIRKLARGRQTTAFRNRFIDADGRYHWFDWTARADQQVLYGSARDVTRLVASEERLRGVTAELETRNQELQDFTSIASHDLQEPLRKIIAFADRIEHRLEGQVDERTAVYLERMKLATLRMRTFIQDLLALSRVSTHQEEPTVVDPALVIADVLETMGERVQATGAAISLGELPKVRVDAMQVQQVFQNLLSNAIKYQPDGQKPEVTISGEVQGNRVHFTVADNGIGFEQQYAERIFRPFQRLHGSSQYSGTGMGLAICKKIIERHGGHITGNGDDGATFTFDLPGAGHG